MIGPNGKIIGCENRTETGESNSLFDLSATRPLFQ